MSLDLYLMKNKKQELYWTNITHNLNKMSARVIITDQFGKSKRSLYTLLWYPEKMDIYIQEADDMVYWLTEALRKLHRSPKIYKKYNPPNEWGSLEGLITFCENLLLACIRYPHARIEVSR